MEDTSGNCCSSVHNISEAGRLLNPTSSRWNSTDVDYTIFPQASSSNEFASLPSRYSKSINFHLSISDRKHFQRCLIASVSLLLIGMVVIVMVFTILSHRKHHHSSSKDLAVALTQSLSFFDAQKSGHYPRDNGIKFRGDSGLHDGSTTNTQADLVGGFYDSGNNMKFSFPTAYTVTLLSWSVIEYHNKYADLNELDHVKDIIRWGSNYLLKLFVHSNTSTDSAIIYSQVGTPGGTEYKDNNDISCWQRPEDMNYPRPVSICDTTASDLAGEIVAGMSAASLIFNNGPDKFLSEKLVQAAELLFDLALKVEPLNRRTYTSIEDCGGRAKQFYNSSGYKDELVWGAAWLFFATGNNTYLDYATKNYASAEAEEISSSDEGNVFSWDNKMTATAILLTRLRYFRDLGYPYETAFISATNRTEKLMCSYVSSKKFTITKGGLIVLKPDSSGAIQYAATASFLTKLYSDYLELLSTTGITCENGMHSLESLRDFSLSQVHYILGDNPKGLSYVVGYGDHYPTHVHHRAASIPWDGKRYDCGDGDYWLDRKDRNPNTLVGAMVAGPDNNDNFVDDRGKKWFTEPNIWGNAGLTTALIALHPPTDHFSILNGGNLGIDRNGLFIKIQSAPPLT